MIVSLNIQAVNSSNLVLVMVSVNMEVVNFIFNVKALVNSVSRKFVDPDTEPAHKMAGGPEEKNRWKNAHIDTVEF